MKARKIFISAGEISGDLQAAHLARALRRSDPHVELYGCGGERMARAGVDVRVPTAQLGYVGFGEPFRFRKSLRAARAQVKQALLDDRPDLAVLVDGDRFNGFLIDHLHELGIPFVQYFAPLVFFWGAWRARHLARRAQLVIPAFPVEVNLLRKAGAKTEWFGHPLREVICEDVRNAVPKATAPRTIALMPGSRWHEIARILPTLLESANALRRRYPDVRFILPLAASHLLPTVKCALRAAGLEDAVTIIDSEIYAQLSQCKLVLVASGTATLEVALLGIPMVVFYKLHPLTYAAARLVVRTKFISMPNILLGRAVVPELIQGDFTAERLTAEALRLLEDREQHAAMRSELAGVGALLGGTDVLDRVSDCILDLVNVPAADSESETSALAMSMAMAS